MAQFRSKAGHIVRMSDIIRAWRLEKHHLTRSCRQNLFELCIQRYQKNLCTEPKIFRGEIVIRSTFIEDTNMMFSYFY
uniref:Uncharacterized protein n=1 Tax=Romanomermis culicivorax TaxID=13658 RepID=A0A915K095_ROMCU